MTSVKKQLIAWANEAREKYGLKNQYLCSQDPHAVLGVREWYDDYCIALNGRIYFYAPLSGLGPIEEKIAEQLKMLESGLVPSGIPLSKIHKLHN